MKKLLFYLLVTGLLFSTSNLTAREASLGFMAGYAWSDYGYIDDLADSGGDPINQNGYSMGLELWAGGLIQMGFLMNLMNPYRDNNSSDGADNSFYTFQLMFGFRAKIVKGFFFGGAMGYELGLVCPEDRAYGDDGLVAMLLTGYEFRVTRKVIVSPGFRVLWAFEQKHVFTSFIPAISVAYEF